MDDAAAPPVPDEIAPNSGPSGGAVDAPGPRRAIPESARRTAAVLTAVCALAGLALIWFARSRAERHLYVSEMGAAGEPTAELLHAALLFVAAAGALGALATWGMRARPRLLAVGAPSLSLLVSSVFFLVAAQVPCTPRCPIPYGPGFTWPDFIHTTAAVIAFAAAAWAMLQSAGVVGRRLLARISLLCAIGVGGISAAGGLMSLFAWNAGLGAWFEFTATSIGLLWIALLGAVLVRREPAASRL